MAAGGSGVAWPNGVQPWKGSRAEMVGMTMRWPWDATVCHDVCGRGLMRWLRLRLSHGIDK